MSTIKKGKDRLTNIDVDEVSAVDRAANRRRFAVVKSNSEEVEMAEWSTEFINALPDSAFLFIEAGGETDDEGKTAPRELRHFPIYNAEGELDQPQLRLAIEAIPQSTVEGLDEAKMAELQGQANALLVEEAPADPPAPEASIEGGEPEVKEGAEGDPPTPAVKEGEMPLREGMIKEMTGALNKMLAALLTAVGTMDFEHAMKQLDNAWDILWDIRSLAGKLAIIKSADGAESVSIKKMMDDINAKRGAAGKAAGKVTKSAEPEPVQVNKALGEQVASMATTLKALQKAHDEKTAELEARIFKAEGKPAATPTTGAEAGTKRGETNKSQGGAFVWPEVFGEKN